MKEYYFIFNIYNNLRCFLTQKNMLYLINRKKWENNKKRKEFVRQMWSSANLEFGRG